MTVVTTPTGKIGSELVSRLLEAGEPVRVIARDPGKLPPQVRGRVDVVVGAHDDPGVVSAAFEGAEAVFLVVPFPFDVDDVVRHYLRFVRAATEAIKRHAVKRLVYVSGLRLSPSNPSAQPSLSAAIENAVGAAGCHYRALWCGSFMENLLGQIRPLKNQDAFFQAARPDLRAPLVAARDIAATAARLLLDRSWRGGGGVAVLGPEDLSCNDMARIMSEVVGKPIRFQQISQETFKRQFLQAGGSEAVAQWLIEMHADAEVNPHGSIARGADNTTPFTFREWCEEVLKPVLQG